MRRSVNAIEAIRRPPLAAGIVPALVFRATVKAPADSKTFAAWQMHTAIGTTHHVVGQHAIPLDRAQAVMRETGV